MSPNLAIVFLQCYAKGLPVNGDGAWQGEGYGVARCAGCAHPVGGGCRGPVPVHVAAVCQQAVRRVAYRVLVHGGRHSGDAAAYCANDYEIIILKNTRAKGKVDVISKMAHSRLAQKIHQNAYIQGLGYLEDFLHT
jgi:hypothetical protein